MTALELLATQFPGKTFIPMVDAGNAIGYKKQTCYNLHHANRFPLPVKKLGAKNMVSLIDLAHYMEGKQVVIEVQTPPEVPVKRRPGRPTKAEQRATRVS